MRESCTPQVIIWVDTNVELVSSLFVTISVSLIRISHFLTPVGYGYWTVFCHQFHLQCSQIVEIVFPTFIDGCGRAKGSSNWSHGSAPAAPTPSAYRATSLPTTHITFQVLWPYCLGNFHLQIFWAISLVH